MNFISVILIPETESFLCLAIKGKAIGLPDDFLAMKEGSKGGGVIQVEFHLY